MPVELVIFWPDYLPRNLSVSVRSHTINIKLANNWSDALQNIAKLLPKRNGQVSVQKSVTVSQRTQLEDLASFWTAANKNGWFMGVQCSRCLPETAVYHNPLRLTFQKMINCRGVRGTGVFLLVNQSRGSDAIRSDRRGGG